MSLDISLVKTKTVKIFRANITHNLTDMADAAGIYKSLWRPDEIGITRASQLIATLEDGLDKLKTNPDKYRKYDSTNGWGKYDDFVPWLEKYIDACKQDPDSIVDVSR